MVEKGTAIEIVEKAIMEFYHDLRQDEQARYRSWEHCYANFFAAHQDENRDNELLSLHLSFYLASWGMYRGSSFLLQKDYTVHLPVVKELLQAKYKPLMGIRCDQLLKESNQQLLAELEWFMRDYYDKIRKEVRGQELKNQVSDTLITKILMGTLGCVPAYDRYFVSGIRQQKVASGTFGKRSLLQLAEFYEEHAARLELRRKEMTIGSILYPQMKLLDMGFWQIGYDLDMMRKR